MILRLWSIRMRVIGVISSVGGGGRLGTDFGIGVPVGDIGGR